MKHFIFHLGFLVSEKAPDEDYGGAEVVKDVGRRHVDIHVYAVDYEAAALHIQEKIKALLEDPAPDGGPYVGPV